MRSSVGLLVVTLMAVLTLAGCPAQESAADAGQRDSGSGGGGGMTDGTDAGVAPTDSGVAPTDSGVEHDAGLQPDSGIGEPQDGGSPSDDAGLAEPLNCAMLAYAAGSQELRAPPFMTLYPAFSDAGTAGQGANNSFAGYSISVTLVDGGSPVQFGVLNTGSATGVPWDDADGRLTDGNVAGFALTLNDAGATYQIAISFERPVEALRFAVTNLDMALESFHIEGFESLDDTTPVPVVVTSLNAPATYPPLANDMAHGEREAFIVDGTQISYDAGVYQSMPPAGSSTRSGTVLFSWGSTDPIQRIELTYAAGAGAGIGLAGFRYRNMCGNER